MNTPFPFCAISETSDNATACLEMMAIFHGECYKENLRKINLSPDKIDLSVKRLRKEIQRIGLKCTEELFTIKELTKSFELPCILQWQNSCFVVLYKIVRSEPTIFYIADPKKGLLKYNELEFCKYWLNAGALKRGRVLVIEPNAGNRLRNPLKCFFARYSKYKNFVFCSNITKCIQEEVNVKELSEIYGEGYIQNKKQNNIKIHVAEAPRDIVIKDLTFQYEDPYSQKALKNINLVIPQGKVTAIVGASGSGKTTLLRLLLGNYTFDEGSIHVGHFPLAKFDLSWWRNQCGIIMEDSLIFSESIAKNIAVSSAEIDQYKLQYATRMANLDQFVSQLPLSYNTLVGSRGVGLNHIQKQKLLIARLIYKDPQFLFLDDVVNSIDSANKRIILDNLRRFYTQKTVVVVSQRVKILKNVDQIVVLHNGEIVEIGTHDELLQSGGRYFQLVKEQLSVEMKE